MSKSAKLVIDAEFAKLLIPLTPDELELLECSLLRDGCLHPLTAWRENGRLLLIDGHHRFDICTKHGIKFEVQTVEVESRESAKTWVRLHQLARRNLNESQRAMQAARITTIQHGGDRKGDQSPKSDVDVSASSAAELLNVGRGQVFEAKKVIAKGAPDVIKAVDSGKIAVSGAARLIDQKPEIQRRVVGKILRGEAKSAIDAMRQIRQEDAGLSPPLPAGKYRIFYCDAPYSYGDGYFANIQEYGAASHHYKVLSIEELCALRVAEMAADDSMLFTWVPAPMLQKSFAVVEAWGFTYKGMFIWDKVRHNFGHYNSVRHELLLICVRGNCTPDNPKLYDSVQSIERTEHSVKPERFREIIDDLYPPRAGRNDRCELFARRIPPKHWDFWGNEVAARGEDAPAAAAELEAPQRRIASILGDLKAIKDDSVVKEFERNA